MKKISGLLFLLCFVFLFSMPVHAGVNDVPSVDNTTKVYDNAELFDESQEQELRSELKAFADKNSLDIALVTTNENRQTAMEYADDFYDYNNFGIGESKDGLLLLIDMSTRTFWISTKGKAISVYEDRDIDTILDDAYKSLGVDKTDFYKAAKTFIKVSQWKYDAYLNQNTPQHIILIFVTGVIFNPFALIITLVILAILLSIEKKNSNKLDRTAASYFSASDVKVLDEKDTFVRTNTSRRTIQSSSGSSGGGSSTHRSSSGSTHGGGGRSF